MSYFERGTKPQCKTKAKIASWRTSRTRLLLSVYSVYYSKFYLIVLCKFVVFYKFVFFSLEIMTLKNVVRSVTFSARFNVDDGKMNTVEETKAKHLESCYINWNASGNLSCLRTQNEISNERVQNVKKWFIDDRFQVKCKIFGIHWDSQFERISSVKCLTKRSVRR